MRINDIEVDGFGVWKGLKVENLAPGMTVFYGQNEAGKTTLMHFLRTMLFGFSDERRNRYLPPVYGGLAGGEIQVITSQGNYQIQRHIDPNRLNDVNGDLVLIDEENGTNYGKNQLASLLSSIDEPIFNNVFAIGLREIQELNTLNSTDAAEHLYKLTTGVDRVSLVDVMKDLRKRRESLWNPAPDTRSRLGELHARRRNLQREIDELAARSRRWSRIAAQSGEAARTLEELAARLKSFEKESRTIELAIQTGDRWRSRRTVLDQIQSMGNLPDANTISVKDLDKLNVRIAQQREKITKIRAERKSVRREGLSIPVNRQLLSLASRVDAISEHLPWIEALQAQAARVRGEINSIRTSLGGEVSSLGSRIDLKSKDVRELANQGVAALQNHARKLVAKREELDAANDSVERAKSELGQYEGRMQSALIAQGDGVSNSREDAARLVNRLRRRMELEEKVNRLNAQRHDLERDIDDVVNEQVLPVGKLSILGVVFIIGIVLAGFGLWNLYFTGGQQGNTVTEMGFLLMILGTVFGLTALALKHHWERIARDELDDFRHQFDLVRQQLKRTRAERDELDRQLPAGAGEWELQLKDAEGSLSRLEDLIPLESRYQAATAALDEAKRRREKMQKELEDLDRRWREGLRMVGMPENLAPDQLKEVTQRSERIQGFHSRLEQLEAEAAERDKEVAQLDRRIDALLGEADIKFDSKMDTATRLQTLRVTLGEQRRLLAQRKELAAKFRSYRSSDSKAVRELDRLLGQKRRMLAIAGADSEEQYRQFASQHAHLGKLRDQAQALTDQISAALGGYVSEEVIAGYLDQYGQSGLEKQWEQVISAIETTKQEQARVHQQRGEFLQEMKLLGEDSRLDEARLELAATLAEIRELSQQWQVLAVSGQMLENIRETYESRRQPETLLEASAFLSRLTEGHYVRIWTRLTGEELLVDNAKGETLPVEQLSRGTREAVYLGLRLALVDAYARRGAVVPLILDDVLVNFDSNRARAAATVLRDFAKSGYQVLMFTCHEHFRDMFRLLDVDVRVLPHHKDVVERHAVPISLGKPEVEPAPIAAIEEPVREWVPEPVDTPVENRYSPIRLETDEVDPELEYELTAVGRDQQRLGSAANARFTDFENPEFAHSISAPLNLTPRDWIQMQRSA